MTYTALLRLFSGKENPSWKLSEEEETELRKKISSCKAFQLRKEVLASSGLGYSGIELRDNTEGKSDILVHKGIIWDGERIYADSNFQIEKWLLHSAFAALPEKITKLITTELERNPFSIQNAITEKMLSRLEQLALPLALLHQLGWDARTNQRTFLMKNNDQLLAQVRNREGHFKNYPDSTCLLIEKHIYIDMVSRICQLCEDFALVSSALKADLADFPSSIARTHHARQSLKNMAISDWDTLLRYKPLEEIDLTTSERSLLQEVRKTNYHALDCIRTTCIAFIDLYWSFYLCHLHGNKLLYKIPDTSLDGNRTVIILGITEGDATKAQASIFVTDEIYRTWKLISTSLVRVLDDLVARSVEYINRGEAGVIEFSNLGVLEDSTAQGLHALVQQKDQYRHYFAKSSIMNFEMSESTFLNTVRTFDLIEELLPSYKPLWL